MSRFIFGLILSVVGLLYIWLAIQAVRADSANGDWVAYLGAFLFFAAGIGAAFAGINLVRAKRR